MGADWSNIPNNSIVVTEQGADQYKATFHNKIINNGSKNQTNQPQMYANAHEHAGCWLRRVRLQTQVHAKGAGWWFC